MIQFIIVNQFFLTCELCISRLIAIVLGFWLWIELMQNVSRVLRSLNFVNLHVTNLQIREFIGYPFCMHRERVICFCDPCGRATRIWILLNIDECIICFRTSYVQTFYLQWTQSAILYNQCSFHLNNISFIDISGSPIIVQQILQNRISYAD